MKNQLRSHVIVIIAGALLSAPLFGQATAPRPPTPQSTSPSGLNETVELDVLVVTGRAGTDFRTKAETSYALTDISSEQLRLQAPMGLAEALKAIPGFWIEASGGEASNNIRARGIPADGFSTVALQEDGLPIQHDGGLGWLNADQSFRIDETVQRMEVVRGGPSSVFASNAPGGIVNFVTRRGGDEPEGQIRYEVGDFNHHRVEGWHGGPAGPWRYGFGGFWRVSDGVRDPGFRANDGYQLRFSLGRDLPGGGNIDANIKYIDDHVIFYLPVPLTFDGDDPAGIPGFDPNFGTVVGPETQRVHVRTPAGLRTIDVESGTHVELAQFTANYQQPLAAGWRLENGFRYRTSLTKRENFFPNNLTAGATRLAQLRTSTLAAFPTATDVQFRYVTTPSATFDPLNQNSNGLVLDGTAIGIKVDLDETINDLRLLRKFSIANQTHDVAFGFYLAALDEKFRDLRATLFTDVRSNARLLDLVAVNSAGAEVGKMTDNGVFRHGSNFANGVGDSFTTAFYASDEWQITRQLRLDLGVRWERIETDGRTERPVGVNLGGSPAAANVLTGTGIYDPYDRSFDRTGWTVGADWQFTSRNGLFARFTPTFRLPSVGSFITNPNATPVIQRTDLYEVGYKYVSQPFDVFVTAFKTTFDNFSFTDTVFNPATGGTSMQTVFIKTDAQGIELEGNLRPAPWFDFAASATFQQPEFEDFRVSQLVNNVLVPVDYSGNRLLRVPEVSFRVVPGFNLLGNRLRVQFPIEYYGDRYADAANSVKLPSYRVFYAALRYQLNPQTMLYANIDNLDNEIGLTEGNPRSGQFQSGDAGARYYLARPILGRSYRAAITYRF